METPVFIDTSLGTRLVLTVSSDSDTISDFKRNILCRHPLLFPNIGEIKINALKVKRNGYFYHLFDSMLVKSAFAGEPAGNWFLLVDASVAEEPIENRNSIEPDISNSSDVVPVNEALLLQDGGDDRHVKPNSESLPFGSSNSTKENSDDLCKEVEHSANSNPQVPFPANNTGSMLNVESKVVGDDKIHGDLPASVATPVLKKKLKSKKRKKDAIHHDLKEKGALVVEGEKDALDSGNGLEENLFQTGPSLVLNDANLGNQIRVDETSSLRKKRSAAGNKMVVEGMKVPGDHPELETNKHKDVSCNDQENKSKENSLQSGPATMKKHKVEKKDGNENSLMENVEQATCSDTFGQKREITTAVVDHLNTEFINQNRLLDASRSAGKKKRKRQKSNLSQAVSEVSPVKDVHEDTFQSIHSIKDKDLGSKGGEISEPCLISPMKIQEVSERNRAPHPGGDDDMDGANDGNMESKNKASKSAVASVTNMRDSCDQNSIHVDGHPTQESINFRKAFGVLAHGTQSDSLEVVEENVEQNKSFKKVKKSKKKSKDIVGGTEAVDPVHNISPADLGGTTDGKEEIQTKKLDCSPSVTDFRADDVIQDVLESLQQCKNGPANADNMEKKSKKKTKKKSSTAVAPPELQGKDDVDHQDSTILVHNASEVNASSKSTWKTVEPNSSSAVQLNGSDLESDKNTPRPEHDGRPIQDIVGVDQPKSNYVDNANNSKEVPGGSGPLKSQQGHAIVDSGEIIIDKAKHTTGVETAMKGKKNSKTELSSSGMLNGNKRKEAKAKPVKSRSIQSQGSFLKFEPSGSNVKSSKPPLTVSGSAAKEPLQSKGSADKIDSTPKNAQRPIDINSSRAHTDLKKNKTCDVSSSDLKTPKNTIHLKRGGNERQFHLDIAKATESDSRKVANSLADKKSLLATMGTIFGHGDKESSDDEDGVSDSDSSTRTPSGSSSYSGNSHENGSYSSEGEETSGRKKQKPGSSSSKSMSLHAILLNSSSYKKAKLTASQGIDSQPEEFVPESQPT